MCIPCICSHKYLDFLLLTLCLTSCPILLSRKEMLAWNLAFSWIQVLRFCWWRFVDYVGEIWLQLSEDASFGISRLFILLKFFPPFPLGCSYYTWLGLFESKCLHSQNKGRNQIGFVIFFCVRNYLLMIYLALQFAWRGFMVYELYDLLGVVRWKKGFHVRASLPFLLIFAQKYELVYLRICSLHFSS